MMVGMMAMASLKVLSQVPAKPLPGLYGNGLLITFEPGSTQVLRPSPDRLTLEFLQPN